MVAARHGSLMVRHVPLHPELVVDFLLVLLVVERNALHVLESGWENTPLALYEFNLGREKAVSQEFHLFLIGHVLDFVDLGVGWADGCHDRLVDITALSISFNFFHDSREIKIRKRVPIVIFNNLVSIQSS